MKSRLKSSEVYHLGAVKRHADLTGGQFTVSPDNIALLNIFKLAEALGVEPSVLLEAPAAGQEPTP